MNGAGDWSQTVSSRPIHVYGANVPGIVQDGRDVSKINVINFEFHKQGESHNYETVVVLNSHMSNIVLYHGCYY